MGAVLPQVSGVKRAPLRWNLQFRGVTNDYDNFARVIAIPAAAQDAAMVNPKI
jgi:hypothetical protein